MDSLILSGEGFWWHPQHFRTFVADKFVEGNLSGKACYVNNNLSGIWCWILLPTGVHQLLPIPRGLIQPLATVPCSRRPPRRLPRSRWRSRRSSSPRGALGRVRFGPKGCRSCPHPLFHHVPCWLPSRPKQGSLSR